MGTMIPLYGYVNPYADKAPRRGLIERRDVLVASVNRLLIYVSRDDVKSLKERVMHAADFNPDTDAWTHAAVYETDPDARPVLDRLLRGINMDGSIVVPTIDDIEYPHNETTFNLIRRILHDGVPIISMNWVSDEQQSILQFSGDHVADVRVFEHLWKNSMTVREQLRAFVANEKRMLRAYNEGVEPNNGVGQAL